MGFDLHLLGSHVSESYSRQLDKKVALQEMPYGYDEERQHVNTESHDKHEKKEYRKERFRHG